VVELGLTVRMLCNLKLQQRLYWKNVIDSMQNVYFFKNISLVRALPNMEKLATIAINRIKSTIKTREKASNANAALEVKDTREIASLLNEFIRIHILKYGYQKTNMDLRLIGNALRIACHDYHELQVVIKEITWGIDAEALHAESSGEAACLAEAILFLSETRGRPIIFDIGGSKGDWTQMIAKITADYEVHIFEPNKSLMPELNRVVKGIMRNAHKESRIIINPLGIGKNKIAKLFISKVSDELASTASNMGESIYEDYKEVFIDLISGEEYCKSKGLSCVDYLKIDTEGSEFEALESFRETPGIENIKFIQFEYSIASYYANAGLNKFFSILNSSHDIHRILPEGLTEKLTYSQYLENFKWSNFLAIRKDQKDFFKRLSIANH